MSAWRKEPQVGEFLVRRNEPPSLCLYTFPKIVVRHAAPALIEQSLAMVTALNEAIGYDAAAAIAKESVKSGKTVRQLCLEKNVLPKDQLDRLLDARRMTGS